MMFYNEEVMYDYSDVMLLPQLGGTNAPQSRADVNLLDESGRIPIIAANMDGIGTFEMALELAKYNMMTALHKHYTVDELVQWYSDNENISDYVIYSMGANTLDREKWCTVSNLLKEKGSKVPKIVCVDVANGYTKDTAYFISSIKGMFNIKIIAGNVVTREGVAHLVRAGADVIKVGIGPGSVCTTRKLTGIGYPQFSAILECADHAHNYHKDIQIIADGGITCPGDIAKALAAGADYVMLGGMFAGHDEGNGVPCDITGDCRFTVAGSHRKFYGMASKAAQDIHNGGVAEYRASEGKEVIVPYRGPVRYTVEQILGGLRSSCAYQGIKNLSDISRNPQFIRVSRQLNNVFGG